MWLKNKLDAKPSYANNEVCLTLMLITDETAVKLKTNMIKNRNLKKKTEEKFSKLFKFYFRLDDRTIWYIRPKPFFISSNLSKQTFEKVFLLCHHFNIFGKNRHL